MITRLILLCVLACVAWPVASFEVDWSKWRTYENSYFRIHSNAQEKRVLRLLKELESFRLVVKAAVLVKVPEGANKTDVILFRNRREFRKVSWHQNIAGFVTIIDGQPIAVLPWSKRGLDTESVIKHEYVHIAQAYDNRRYPRWWREGLAEMLSTVEYHGDAGEIALVGKPNAQRWEHLSRELDYNKLIADDYDGLKTRYGADAYAQYWLLAIYSMTHDNGIYRDALAAHIIGYRKTGDAFESFVEAYGRTPKDFAKEAMRNFGRRSYSYKPLLYKLDVTQMDITPLVSALDVDVVERIVQVLHTRIQKEKAKKK